MSEKKKSVYASIADDILSKIKSGAYPIDSLLPAEREFMEIYSVQRTTVRRGLDILSADGYIKKIAGLGSVVQSKKPVPVLTEKQETKVNLTVVKAPDTQRTNDIALLLSAKNMDVLPKSIVNLIAEMGSVYITDSIDSIPNGNTIIVLANENADISGDCCFALSLSDDHRSVVLDSDKAAYTALTYLESLGHKSFAYIGTNSSYAFENAFLDSFSAVNSYFDSELVSLSGSDEKAGFDGFSELFRRHGGKFTAICTVNDDVARGVIKAAKYYRISIPDELSVISLCSFDKKGNTDAIYFDVHDLADEILDSAQVYHRVSTVLFGGTLKVSGTSANVKDRQDSGSKISNFLL